MLARRGDKKLLQLKNAFINMKIILRNRLHMCHLSFSVHQYRLLLQFFMLNVNCGVAIRAVISFWIKNNLSIKEEACVSRSFCCFACRREDYLCKKRCETVFTVLTSWKLLMLPEDPAHKLVNSWTDPTWQTKNTNKVQIMKNFFFQPHSLGVTTKFASIPPYP